MILILVTGVTASCSSFIDSTTETAGTTCLLGRSLQCQGHTDGVTAGRVAMPVTSKSTLVEVVAGVVGVATTTQ